MLRDLVQWFRDSCVKQNHTGSTLENFDMANGSLCTMTVEEMFNFHEGNTEKFQQYIKEHGKQFSHENPGGYVLLFFEEGKVVHKYFDLHYQAVKYRNKKLDERQAAQAFIWPIKRPGVVYAL